MQIKWTSKWKENIWKVLVAQSCPTLCSPMNCVACQAPLSVEFPRQEYCSSLPSPGNPPDSGIEAGSPALQVDTLPSEPPGKPIFGMVVHKPGPLTWGNMFRVPCLVPRESDFCRSGMKLGSFFGSSLSDSDKHSNLETSHAKNISFPFPTIMFQGLLDLSSLSSCQLHILNLK